MIFSGTRYRRPFIKTSSTFIDKPGGAAMYCDWITSILPLLNCRGFVISIGLAYCLGTRRLGGCLKGETQGVIIQADTHEYSLNMIGTHPFLVERGQGGKRRIEAVKMPVESAVITRYHTFPRVRWRSGLGGRPSWSFCRGGGYGEVFRKSRLTTGITKNRPSIAISKTM